MNECIKDFSVRNFINDLFGDLTLTLPALGCRFKGISLTNEQIVRGQPSSLKNKIFLLFAHIALENKQINVTVDTILKKERVMWYFVLNDGESTSRFEECPSWDSTFFCTSLPNQKPGFTFELPQGNPLPESPILDWNKLFLFYGRTLGKDIAKSFFNRAETLLFQLQKAFIEENANEAFRMSHCLKGASRSVFAFPFSSCAAQLEESTCEGSLKNAKPLLNCLQDSYQELKLFFLKTNALTS